MASAIMETILEASAVTATAVGRLSVGSKDSESICGWLAVARIALLEVWVEAGTRSDTGQTLDLANQTTIDGRILALAAIPRGSREDHLLLAKDVLAWELVLLRPKPSSDIDGAREENAGRDVSIQLVVLASGSLGSGPRDYHARAASALFAVWRPSIHLAKERKEEGDRDRKESSEIVAGCACEGTLTLLAFYGTGQRKAGVDGILKRQATFPIPADARRRSDNCTPCQGFQGAHDECLQGFASGKSHACAPAAATAVLDIVFVHRYERGGTEFRDVRPFIALLLDDTETGGDSVEGGRDRRRKVALQTYRWDWDCGGDLSLGYWRVENLHPATLIAALAGGGLLCVGPEGVRIFGEDGRPLLGGGRSRGQDLMISVPVSAGCHCPWGANALAALTPVPNAAVGRGAQNDCGRGETMGEREDFLVIDVVGDLHRISVFDDHAVGVEGVGHRSGQEARDSESGRRRSCARIECAKLEPRSGPGSPLPAKANFILPVGFDGLIFVGGHSSSFQAVARLLSDTPSDLLARRNRLLGAESPGADGAPAVSWRMLQHFEAVGGALAPVTGIVAAVGDSARRCNRLTLYDRRQGTPPTESLCDFGHTGDLSGTQEMPEGFRAVLAAGGIGDATGGGMDPATSLCILEHGLTFDAVAEGFTGLPAGATLFTEPLSPRTVEGCLRCRPGHGIRAARDAGGEVEGGDVQGGHLLLFSDRARATTHVSKMSLDGEVSPVVEMKGFACDRHTIHLGRVGPGDGYIVQVTENSVHLVEPAGLLPACSWRPSSPSFKAQHAATAGAVVAVVSESTLVLLTVEAPTRQVTGGAGKASEASKAALNEVYRVRLDDGPVSALGMRSLGNTAKEEDRGGGGGGGGGRGATPPVVIAIAYWDCPLVKMLSWPTPPTSDARAAPNQQPGLPEGSVLAEFATWRPPWEVQAGAKGKPNHTAASWAADRAQETMTLTRGLAFVWSEETRKRLSLVAATAGGAVAVAEWSTRGGPEVGRGKENAGEGWTREGWLGKGWLGEECAGKLATSASFQIGHGLTQLAVFGGEGGGENEGGIGGKDYPGLFHGGERVFVGGGRNAVLLRRPDGQRSRAEGQGMWRCVQVCRTGRYPRQSVAHLPHRGNRADRGDAGAKFVWLTTRESSTQDTDPRPSTSTAGVGGSDATKRDYAGISHDEALPRWLFLSVGTLSKQPRGQCYKKPLPLSPTHLVYVPITRSIVVACDDYGDNAVIAEESTSGASRGNAEQVLSTPRCSSNLRVFDADTLEERPGGPLHLLPGVRVTGMALLGLDRLRNTSHESGPHALWTDGEGIPPAAAVGGNVVAVACCSARACGESTSRQDDCRQEQEEVQEHRGSGATSGSTTANVANVANAANANASAATADADSDDAANIVADDDCKPDTLVTVLAAFEVVACANHVVTGTDGGSGLSASRCKVSNGSAGSGTILAPLAAASEMEGVFFSLKTLRERFVAASADDKVVVFGWDGSEGSLRPDQPAPPLALSPVASCRTSAGMCVTALGTSGSFIAVAEFLHSVSLYRFDPKSKVISLVARHARSSLIVTALALSPEPLASGFPLVALADRTSGTVAVLACPFLRDPKKPNSQGSAAAPNGATGGRGGGGWGGAGEGGDGGVGGVGAGVGVGVGGVIGDGERNQGTERGGNGSTHGNGAVNLGSLPAVDPLRLVAVWPGPEKVTSLEAVEATSPEDDRDSAERVQFSGGRRVDSVFMLGTAAGAILTVRVSPPHVPSAGNKPSATAT